jgi:hypothetical protein
MLLAYNLLIYGHEVKSLMPPIKRTILIGMTIAFALTLPLNVSLMMVQAQIITLPQNTNNTRVIVNMDNHTLTFVNATTNETISVKNFTLYRGNATTNETLPTNTGNATTNETLPTNTGNTTTNENLTAKFNELQGK